MRRVGWGVFGCSDIVKRGTATAIVQQANSRLVAFHSRDESRGREFAVTYGADKVYTSVERMLVDPEIDIVYVATEVDRHASLTIAAANAGKHVLVEKPMALNTEECLQMIEACRRNGVHLAVAYYARFLPKAQAIRNLIQEGRLGTIVRANLSVVSYYNPDPADPKYWRVTGNGGGNVLADVGTHRLDMLTYFIGRPLRVVGLADRLTMGYEAADTETALVQFEQGVHVTVLANANVPASGSTTGMELYGTRGSLLDEPWSKRPISIVGSDMEPFEVPVPESPRFPMIDDFAGAIAAGRAPRFNGVDGMWATAVVHGVYESLRTGRVLTIPPVPER